MNERGIDWMLCIKENAGNKAFRNFIKELFDSLDVIECFSHQTIDKVGGRIEIKDYEIIPIEKLTLLEEVKVQSDTKMVARVTSSTTIYRRDDKKIGIEPKTSITTLYYISNVVSLFKGNPLLALDYEFKFLETPPVES